MRTIIVYNSQTGFTEKYAGWIAEELGCECMSLHTAKKLDFWDDYDAIIFGSWVSAEKIKDIDWVKSNMIKHPTKKYLIYAVGAAPAESPVVEKMLTLNMLSEKHSEKCTMFYCPGGINYDKMSFFNRLILKSFSRMLAKKKDKTEQEQTLSDAMGHNFDNSDRKYIEPIVTYMRRFDVLE
ncbi:MAG: flavodoxin domain-containing protein [Eubacteriaceae bacterium]|nr:flavodoxin domain-containing protein [Eubacteriaceae bacterium]